MKGDYTNKKKRMRHTYEIHAILSSIYCINETTVKDDDIKRLIEYALYRVYKESCTQMKVYCKDKEKSDVMPDLKMLLASETTYINIKKLRFKK